ncbi:MAG: hypothetical protein AB8B84_18265 [Granulosicoccus sp.]
MTFSKAIPGKSFSDVPASGQSEWDWPLATDSGALLVRYREPGIAVPARSIQRPGA